MVLEMSLFSLVQCQRICGCFVNDGPYLLITARPHSPDKSVPLRYNIMCIVCQIQISLSLIRLWSIQGLLFDPATEYSAIFQEFVSFLFLVLPDQFICWIHFIFPFYYHMVLISCRKVWCFLKNSFLKYNLLAARLL